MAKGGETKDLRKLLKHMGKISETVSSKKPNKKSVPKQPKAPKETKKATPKEVARAPKKVTSTPKEAKPKKVEEAPIPEIETEVPEKKLEAPEVLKNVPEAAQPKPLAPEVMPYEGAVETKLDQLFSLILSKGKLSTDEAAAKLNIKKKLVEEWAEILCEQNLITLTYPSIGKTIMTKKEEKC